MSATLQLVVVAAIVLACSLSLLRRLAPRVAWQAQARLAYALERSRADAFRRLGRALRPPLVATQAACGSGCGRCRRCD